MNEMVGEQILKKQKSKEVRSRKKIVLSVLLPVRNEGTNLKIMLKILRTSLEIPHELLVIYDFAGDNSVPVVKQMIPSYPGLRLVRNRIGKGVVNAIKAGLEASRADIILILTADDIGPVLSVDDMYDLIKNGCDLVSSTRYAYGGRILGGYLISRILSRTANKIFKLISPSALSDLTIGVKMFRKSIMEKIKLESKPVGWAVAFELSVKAQLAGFKLGEVPIISINRFYGGKSSFKFGPWVMEYLKWFYWGIKKLYISGKIGQKAAVHIPSRLKYTR